MIAVIGLMGLGAGCSASAGRKTEATPSRPGPGPVTRTSPPPSCSLTDKEHTELQIPASVSDVYPYRKPMEKFMEPLPSHRMRILREIPGDDPRYAPAAARLANYWYGLYLKERARLHAWAGAIRETARTGQCAKLPALWKQFRKSKRWALKSLETSRTLALSVAMNTAHRNFPDMDQMLFVLVTIASRQLQWARLAGDKGAIRKHRTTIKKLNFRLLGNFPLSRHIPYIYWVLGITEAEGGHHTRAIRWFQRASQSSKATIMAAHAHLHKARSHLAMKDGAKAGEELWLALSHPKAPHAVLMEAARELARLDPAHNEASKACEKLEKRMGRSEDLKRVLVILAEAYTAQKKTQEARIIYAALARMWPQDPRAREWSGR